MGLGVRVGYGFVKPKNSEKVSRSNPPVIIRHDLSSTKIERSTFHEKIRLTIRTAYLMFLYLPLLYIITATWLAESIGFKNCMPYAWSYTIWATSKAGPMWIKLAQWAATRPDIFPSNFCKQCSQFHSCTPMHTWDETVDILSKSYSNWEELLVFEDKTPVGTGCITQVYKAKLQLGTNSQAVAVKVVHPWVNEQMQIDLKLLKNILKLCERVPKFRDYIRWSGLNSTLKEFESRMVSQLDMRTEANNLNRFNENFRHNPHIVFPKPYDDFVTRDILVESFEEGVSISEFFEAQTDIKERIAEIGFDGFVQMVFVDGFYHNDLHPGNILVQEDKGDCKLICLDCGIARSFEGNNMTNVSDICEAIASSDGEHAGKLIYDLSPCNDQCENPDAFFREIREVVDVIDVFRLTFSSACKHLDNIVNVCVKHKVQFEGNYASLGVAAMLLESVGLQLLPDLNPNYNIEFKI